MIRTFALFILFLLLLHTVNIPEMNTPIISSHSQWQPLKEVWIGGTYPDHFYQHLGSRTHDLFAKITEITDQDFDNLAQTLTNLGVEVVRPKFHKIDDFLDENDNLLKPPVSPCDIALTLGDTLHLMPQYPSGIDPYQHAIDCYRQAGQKIHVIDRNTPEPWAWIVFASVVRAGKDIMIDYIPSIPESKISAEQVAKDLSANYRVHISGTGDHGDGTFCPLQPGHIFSSHYRETYDQSFPGWSVFHLEDTTYKNLKTLDTHKKWYLPGVDYGHFNQDIISVAETWLGSPWETVFEVNMLVVDEKNIVCGAYDEHAFRHFESLGITPHLVEFKSRYFWDAGIHCLTSDIHRSGQCEDYWPGRGPNGVYTITEW
jgi:hypothetical protein